MITRSMHTDDSNGKTDDAQLIENYLRGEWAI